MEPIDEVIHPILNVSNTYDLDEHWITYVVEGCGWPDTPVVFIYEPQNPKGYCLWPVTFVYNVVRSSRVTGDDRSRCPSLSPPYFSLMERFCFLPSLSRRSSPSRARSFRRLVFFFVLVFFSFFWYNFSQSLICIGSCPWWFSLPWRKKEKKEKEKKGSWNSGFGQCPGTWFVRIWSK